MNSCHFIGRTTATVDLRYTPSGKPVSSFTLAVDRKFKDSQGNKQTDFVQCICWGKGGEVLAEHVGKGDRLGVRGELNSRKYKNKEGRTVQVWEVNVQDFDLLGKSGGQNNNSGQRDYSNDFNDNPFAGDQKPIDISDDDLPF